MLTRRYNSLDILKIIMAVCVIATHTQPLYGYNNEIVTRLYDSIVGIANPIFFLSTGFLIGKNYFVVDVFVATTVVSVALGLGYSFYISSKKKNFRENKLLCGM